MEGGPGFLTFKEPSLTPRLLSASLSSSLLLSAALIFTLPVQLHEASIHSRLAGLGLATLGRCGVYNQPKLG